MRRHHSEIAIALHPGKVTSQLRLPKRIAVTVLMLLVSFMSAWGSVTTDVSVSTDLSAANTQITSPAFSTSSGNELLLALLPATLSPLL